MRKLSGTDASFLYNETVNTPQHVGSIQYLKVPKHRRASFYDDLKELLLDRVHLLPYLTSRLQAMPWDIDHPVWVRYADFDIDDHVHRIRLDRPGTIEQLEKLCAELYEPILDRSKPLWEWWVVDGLANGQVAVLQKTHHACIDGMASVAAMEMLGDFSPTPRRVEPPPPEFWEVDDVSFQTLMRESYTNLARYNVERWSRWPEQFAANVRAFQRLTRVGAENPLPTAAPKAPWNAPIDAKRGIAGAQFSLAQLKRIGKMTGTKVNDVILGITAEALRRYTSRIGVTLDGQMIAACPVSLRKPGDTTMNNQVTMMSVSLENDVACPVTRLAGIRESSTAAKELLAEASNTIQSDFGGAFFPAMMLATARANESGAFAQEGTQVPANLVVSNVPGLQRPVYYAGAEVVRMTPVSIVTHGSGLNVTVTSYLDRMDLGLTGAKSVIADIHALRDDFKDAYRELVARVLGRPTKVEVADAEDTAAAAA